MALKPSTRHVGSVDSSAPKYNKVIRNGVVVEMEVIPVVVEMPVEPAVVILRKRMASELDALRGLVKKAELLSLGKNGRFLAAESRLETPMKAGGKTPSAKRRKVSPLVEQIETPRMSSDEREQLADRLATLSSSQPDHILEFLKKQCGGDADPHGEFEIDLNSMENSVLFELKKQLDEFAEESKSEAVQEEEDEYVDICGGVSPITIRDASPLVPSSSSDSGSSSASDSDSDTSSSDTESDSDESVRSPAPPAVHVVENDSSAQPPKLATSELAVSEVVQSVEKPQYQRIAPTARPVSNLIDKAKEALERRRQEQRARSSERAREKIRQEVLEVETAALPDESIHPQDLEQLGIAEFEHIVSTLRPRVMGGGLRATRGRPSALQQLGFFLKADA
ncbi:transcription factor GTE9-like [Phragmites australis]|uniref:transcription factor GTE9-like n=1 Tax=Phragmites australis TaxID=29695 RepID=UPI002D78F707|nr:transcription factor GTE9-like [Phragmites australis]